ncbi:hypothetical protein CDD83_513 [Cordyceps sp. RAO-2017]|nr:hypothetical protein CDD83_513 [Cordyceps sp. RAO-2017]
MAIFPGGKSRRINSPRHLTIRHSRRVVAAYRRQLGVLGEADDTDPLPPGEQKLSSFWAPGLEAGPQHQIKVTQTIEANNGNDKLVLEAEQDFSVDAPQFSLPEGSVHSTYPPAGYSDDHRILPHVVLTDPHLPWERLGSRKGGTNKELKARMEMLAAGKVDAAPVRTRVPWLVVLAFSQDELRLPPEDLDGPASIFRKTSAGVIKPVKQSSTMTVNTSIADLWNLTDDVVTPVTKELGPESIKDSRGDFIFVRPDLFTSLFSAFGADGKRVSAQGPDASQYRFLSHVRKINGSGMALAGVEDTAVFGIVVGNRSGPLGQTAPTTMCAHLVSIEGVEEMGWPGQSQRYVALCSLHSWNYTVLPPLTLNVPDAFEHLGRTLDVLRVPEGILDTLRKDAGDDKAKQLVARRLSDGFTLVKYRAQTGEATVALYRGPLTPTYVPPLAHLTSCSNSGVDMQVLDKQLGIMDITYSVAWQVGRTMALGDESFVAALGRLRSAIHGTAAGKAKLQAVKAVDDTAFRTRADVLSDLDGVVKNLATIHLDRQRRDGNPVYKPGGAKRRWFRSHLRRAEKPGLSFASPAIQERYPAEALKASRSLARSRSGEPYDETNEPVSTDWMTVLSWLVDRMFLAGVPSHCLIPDPTYLEPESLRFFHIDRNWVDALLDGALSLGNHFGVDEDRVAIKKALNDYIGTTPKGQGHLVQVPAYGFYLRSDLVTMYPDLRVEVMPDEGALRRAGQEMPAGAPLLRHEIVADGVMMAFMDRLPGSDQFGSLVLTQPAHQQRFAVARGLDKAEVTVDIRRQYTVDQATREKDKSRHQRLDQIVRKPADKDNLFLWDSEPGTGLNDLRILRLPRFAEQQLEVLRSKMGGYDEGGQTKSYFVDDAATSALFAMQLNDPIYNLTVNLRAPSAAASSLVGLGAAGSGPPDIRTLRMLQAPSVKRLAAAGDDTRTPAPETTRKAEDEPDGGEQATFQRHKNYKPTPSALLGNLAPNVRAVPVYREDAPDVPNPRAEPRSAVVGEDPGAEPQGSEPAMAPKYLMRVGSNMTGHWDVITLDTSNLAQDLIFSVVLRQSEVSQFLLMEVAVQIELGPPASSPADSKRFLMQNYTGPGAHMLTNLRFNVLPSMIIDENSKKNVLLLRLVPRSARGWVKATAVRELSFLLGLASINAPLKNTDEIYIQSWAKYCRNPDEPQSDTNTWTIANPDTLVKVINPRYTS